MSTTESLYAPHRAAAERAARQRQMGLWVRRGGAPMPARDAACAPARNTGVFGLRNRWFGYSEPDDVPRLVVLEDGRITKDLGSVITVTDSAPLAPNDSHIDALPARRAFV